MMLFQLFWIAVSVMSRETAREMSALGLIAWPGATPAAALLVVPALDRAAVFCAWARGANAIEATTVARATASMRHDDLRSDGVCTGSVATVARELREVRDANETGDADETGEASGTGEWRAIGCLG